MAQHFSLYDIRPNMSIICIFHVYQQNLPIRPIVTHVFSMIFYHHLVDLEIIYRMMYK